jgi:hypothetical protein
MGIVTNLFSPYVEVRDEVVIVGCGVFGEWV